PPRSTLFPYTTLFRSDHHRVGPAAAVAVTEEIERLAGAVRVLVIRRVITQLRHARHAVISVGRRKMGEDFAAVEAAPEETVMRWRGEAIPRELLRQEAIHAGFTHQLRQLAGIAEHVRIPEDARALAECLFEIALAVEKLSRQRFAGWEIAVRFNPAAADRDPLAGLDLGADPGKKIGIGFRDDGVLIGLRAGEFEVRIVVHQRDDVRETALAFAPRLLDRPQPRR